VRAIEEQRRDRRALVPLFLPASEVAWAVTRMVNADARELARRSRVLAALEEARGMAAQWNLTPMVQQLDQMIATLRSQN